MATVEGRMLVRANPAERLEAPEAGLASRFDRLRGDRR